MNRILWSPVEHGDLGRIFLFMHRDRDLACFFIHLAWWSCTVCRRLSEVPRTQVGGIASLMQPCHPTPENCSPLLFVGDGVIIFFRCEDKQSHENWRENRNENQLENISSAYDDENSWNENSVSREDALLVVSGSAQAKTSLCEAGSTHIGLSALLRTLVDIAQLSGACKSIMMLWRCFEDNIRDTNVRENADALSSWVDVQKYNAYICKSIQFVWSDLISFELYDYIWLHIL